MSSAKLAVGCALIALALSACGTSSKPVAGSVTATVGQRGGRGVVDDPRTKHLMCLRRHHLQVTRVGQTGMQVGTLPTGPSIAFAPTPGAAQQLQISGEVENAEVIGSAVLYPRQAPDQLLKVVEGCLAEGVSG
jgi:hypothetical protein